MLAKQDEGLPLGAEVDALPAKKPGGAVLSGRFGRLERLSAAVHGDDLWAELKGDDGVWTYMAYGPFPNAAAFKAWLSERALLADPFYYAICLPSGRAVGLAALMEIRPAMRVIEVGHIVYGASLKRTALATEAQVLLAKHAFEDLGFRRYEWKCDALNVASRSAALRLGFTPEGVFRSHMIVKGRNRDTAWFSMTEEEWPARKRAFESWLAPSNFNAQGRQKLSLRMLGAAHGAAAEAEAPMAGCAVRAPRGAEELEACARMMAASEPWITLGRDYEASLKTLRDESKEVYVAALGGQVLGFLILTMRGAFTGYIQTVAVDPERRGQGIGRRLIDFAEKRIFLETPNAFICASSFNPRALRLYESLGYRRVGELADYIVRGHSEILLRKSIAPLNGFKKA